jgi:uncharacterized RDD family membrane protein YckC
MSNNPYAPPTSRVDDPRPKTADDYEYGGFWLRFCATIIDSILIGLITTPLLFAIYGSQYMAKESFFAGPAEPFISYGIPAVLTILFWNWKSATPGKMLLSLKVLDANTFQPMSVGQSIGRYFSYFVSMIVLCIGFMWVGWDARKQGWHDKLAGTVVVKG